MNNASPQRWLTITALSIAAMLTAYRETAVAQQQPMDNTDRSLELVDPNVLRVCADPRNLPFSNETGEGCENKIAELFAEKLHRKSITCSFLKPSVSFRLRLAPSRVRVAV